MYRLIREMRLAARTLVRSRFVTGLAVLTFALGIGVTSAVFSIFNGVLLNRWMHAEHLKTLAVPLVKGRTLDTRDGKGSTTVLIT